MLRTILVLLSCLILSGCIAGAAVIPVPGKASARQPCNCTVDKVEIHPPKAIPAPPARQPDEYPAQWEK